ncbi:ribonuclease D [Nocardioides bigeumensis]|uniref:Ribonuclease D n=1 Tax=Nocardioides bigeumensis TaxID=433657 RepID=A0ABP5KB32_9ACTN
MTDAAGDASEQAEAAETPDEQTPEEAVEPAPLLTLRDGLPEVIETETALVEYSTRLAAGTGPVAIDAERASGYRYSNRAYLVQLRREGAGTALVDPICFESLQPLADALDGTEWILHAATQDLPCLAEIGLRPARLFDTELAGRLLGKPRVGLATLVEEVVGLRMRKEHSAADWSTRPLPASWLEYAALDVEVLLELREAMVAELAAAGKTDWAEQEFEALLSFEPTVREEVWRRTSGAHRLRGRRAQGVVRALWETRDRIARERDVAPGRIIPDSAIVAAAAAMPTDRTSLLAVQGFHGRGAARYARDWVAAIDSIRDAPESDLPGRPARSDGPPQPRAWADRDPVAARRLAQARAGIAALSEKHHVPVENLLTPDFLRRVLWSPPAAREPRPLAKEVGRQLRGYGARQWQIEVTGPTIVAAIIAADKEPVASPVAEETDSDEA